MKMMKKSTKKLSAKIIIKKIRKKKEKERYFNCELITQQYTYFGFIIIGNKNLSRARERYLISQVSPAMTISRRVSKPFLPCTASTCAWISAS